MKKKINKLSSYFRNPTGKSGSLSHLKIKLGLHVDGVTEASSKTPLIF